ncbi:MAG TPA: hypothetical protein VHW23_00635 [Kofleriaceae bacterium]|nr:hypothetical protein [Kofleriaceae bacterium]
MHRVESMPIALDDAKFQQILDVTVGSQPLRPPEVPTVLQLVRLAAEIDLDDDPAEQALLGALTARLGAATGIVQGRVPRLFPVPTDGEERAAQIATLVRQLPTTGARDLAFALAYLMIVSDLELAPVETATLAQLQRALTIPADRASYLAEAVARIVTPGVAEARPATVTC